MSNRVIITKDDVELDSDLFDIRVDQNKGTISFNNSFLHLLKDGIIKITFYTANEEVKKQKSKALYKYNKFEKLNYFTYE